MITELLLTITPCPAAELPFGATTINTIDLIGIYVECDEPNWSSIIAPYVGDIFPPSLDASICQSGAPIPDDCHYELMDGCVKDCKFLFDIAIYTLQHQILQDARDYAAAYAGCITAAQDDYLNCVLVNCDDGDPDCIAQCAEQYQSDVCDCVNWGSALANDISARYNDIIADFIDCMSACCVLVCDDEEEMLSADWCNEPDWSELTSLMDSALTPPVFGTSFCGFAPVGYRYVVDPTCLAACQTNYILGMLALTNNIKNQLAVIKADYAACHQAALDAYIDCVLTNCDDGDETCIYICSQQYQRNNCDCTELAQGSLGVLFTQFLLGWSILKDEFYACAEGCCQLVESPF